MDPTVMMDRHFQAGARTSKPDPRFTGHVHSNGSGHEANRHCDGLNHGARDQNDPRHWAQDYRRLDLFPETNRHHGGPRDQQQLLAQVKNDGRGCLPWRAQHEQPKTISLPVQPVPLAEALVSRLGGQRAGEVVQALTAILPDAQDNHEADASASNVRPTLTMTEYQS